MLLLYNAIFLEPGNVKILSLRKNKNLIFG